MYIYISNYKFLFVWESKISKPQKLLLICILNWSYWCNLNAFHTVIADCIADAQRKDCHLEGATVQDGHLPATGRGGYGGMSFLDWSEISAESEVEIRWRGLTQR